jgi:hypothetical protein
VPIIEGAATKADSTLIEIAVEGMDERCRFRPRSRHHLPDAGSGRFCAVKAEGERFV